MDGSSVNKDDHSKKIKNGVNQTGNVLRNVRGKIDKADESFLSPFSRFSYRIYDFSVEPTQDEIQDTIVDKFSGEEIPYRFTPRVLSKWRVEYFHTPYAKARLARHALYSLVAMFIMFIVSITITNNYIFVSMGIFIAMLINFLLRYSGVGLFGTPVPEIPYLTNLMRNTESYEFEALSYEMHGEEYVPTSEREDEDNSAEPVIQTTFVKQVENHNSKGDPSPATILSNWMNNEARWTQKDLEDKTGGVIDDLKFELLMQDNDVVWENRNVIDALSKQTNSSPDDWQDALNKWRG